MINNELLRRLALFQKNIASRVIPKNGFERSLLIGGADEAFFGKSVISAIVVCDIHTLEPVEEVWTSVKTRFPYIPTFLSFREGPAIIKAYKKLKRCDILLINGCGINHPRGCGLASYVGVLLGIPTIGITQNLLCGYVKNGKIFYENKVVGFEFESKKGCKPIFVAPGNLIGLRSAMKIVKKCIKNHKLPEPLSLAHKLVNEKSS